MILGNRVCCDQSDGRARNTNELRGPSIEVGHEICHTSVTSSDVFNHKLPNVLAHGTCLCRDSEKWWIADDRVEAAVIQDYVRRFEYPMQRLPAFVIRRHCGRETAVDDALKPSGARGTIV